MLSDPALSACALGIRQGGKLCLEAVSLTVKPGEFLGIIGPNGAGKTTLLKALLGLVPVTEGRVFLQGQGLETVSPAQRGRKMAYLPQERLLPYGMSVEEVIALGRLPYHGRDTCQTILGVMEEMGLQDLRRRRVETLSGGEKARVCLARALAVESTFLLVDEPTASLDPAQALKIMEVLGKKVAGGQKAVCAVLHDLSLAAQFCTRLALLKQGCLVAEGAVKDVLTTKSLRGLYETGFQMVGNVPVMLRS